MKPIIIVLIMFLLSSTIIYTISQSTECRETNQLSLINTTEEAIQIGKAYILMAYPEYTSQLEKYSFVAYFDIDDQAWIVGMANKSIGYYDPISNISRKLPMVGIKKNGEIIFLELSTD